MTMFDPTFSNLEKAMKVTAAQQSLIAQNIANIDNPNYEAQDFDAELGKAVKRASRKVTLEEEMAALSKNTDRYSSYVKLLSSKLAILRTIVTQGRS